MILRPREWRGGSGGGRRLLCIQIARKGRSGSDPLRTWGKNGRRKGLTVKIPWGKPVVGVQVPTDPHQARTAARMKLQTNLFVLSPARGWGPAPGLDFRPARLGGLEGFQTAYSLARPAVDLAPPWGFSAEAAARQGVHVLKLGHSQGSGSASGARFKALSPSQPGAKCAAEGSRRESRGKNGPRLRDECEVCMIWIPVERGLCERWLPRL